MFRFFLVNIIFLPKPSQEVVFCCLTVCLYTTHILYVQVIMKSNNSSITSCTLTVDCFMTFVLEPLGHQKRQHPAFNQSTSECFYDILTATKFKGAVCRF